MVRDRKISSIVMAGLSRPSTSLPSHMPHGVDARDKPGHDEETGHAFTFPRHVVPE